MLLALWPLFLMVDTSAIDTPEAIVFREIVEVFLVVDVSDSMVLREIGELNLVMPDTGISVVREV